MPYHTPHLLLQPRMLEPKNRLRQTRINKTEYPVLGRTRLSHLSRMNRGVAHPITVNLMWKIR